MKVLDLSLDGLHEVLKVGVEVLEFVPFPGLKEAARTLLEIWDSLQYVELNRMACLRLTERCADILLSVKDEIDQAGEAVANELQEPMKKLIDAYLAVHTFLTKQMHRPFLKRYLKRDEIVREIAGCDTALSDALEMFGIRIQVRILKQIQGNEARRQEESRLLYESLRNMQRGIPPPALPAPTPTGLLLEGALSSEQISEALRKLRERENELDRVRDLDDLKQLMRTALETKSDLEMCEVLQVARDEMPEAIKTLQRELEREVRRELQEARELQEEEVVVEEVPMEDAMAEWSGESVQGTESARTVSRGNSTSTRGTRSIRTKTSAASLGTRVGSRRDTLDREFIEGGLEALKRMSRGAEGALGLPSWTITRYEVDREEKIGIGYFSDVYRGTWRGRAVAIKCLAQTTPRLMFVHETRIWKTLDHPNVLPLLGASSASGDPPWFFVSPYCKNGSLVEYLKSHVGEGEGSVDLVRAMHEVARGMEYLHTRGVLHGDLKAANVLVYDDGRCVISDFGQSEMKSEVARLSGSPPPHGTLRWQAPELMAGENQLTQEMDVYSFAICCIEILGHGRLPWAMADDDSVRHYVLDRNMRPEIPKSKFATPDLDKIIRICWDGDPMARPSFTRVADNLRHIRVKAGSKDVDAAVVAWKLPSLEEDHSAEASPDPRPHRPLSPGTSRQQCLCTCQLMPSFAVESETYPTGSSFSDASYVTAHGTESDNSGHRHYATEPNLSSSTVRQGQGTVKSSKSASSSSRSSLSELEFWGFDSGYLSPLPQDEEVALRQNERRYRMLLQHEFNANLILPLWTPSQVALGAVGHLSRPLGEFHTLFNAFDPVGSSDNVLAGVLPLASYGKVKEGTQRQDKRTLAQKSWDVVQGFLPTRRNTESSAQSIARRYTFSLRAEHKTAYLCTEATVYRYIEPDARQAPYRWFRENIDRVMETYGERYGLQKEDVFFVIGTLEAPDYALFVSHHHPNGLVHFNVFSGQRTQGQPWGEFQFDFSDDALGPGPSYHEDLPDGGQPRWAKRISESRPGPWDTVLLSRLRFRTDVSEPTAR
ncbi:hypothetical protein OE88DRAFT_1640190 [Heliocybe sulcata]|uniref:Protein kinase domain-containing protein n=1 Tax=Heliocybe sulcata TaxID=5364 RepID=A0A5C3MJ52_9AGAM|nr:hypothetical protein OE88DRAFT_1640190 [Heliocybe sulcata]